MDFAIENNFAPCFITVTSLWIRWRLKSPASRLFTQSFIQAQIKENTKVLRHWPLWGEFAGERWIPRTKGQWRGKCFHLMTSSFNECFLTIQPAESETWMNDNTNTNYQKTESDELMSLLCYSLMHTKDMIPSQFCGHSQNETNGFKEKRTICDEIHVTSIYKCLVWVLSCSVSNRKHSTVYLNLIQRQQIWSTYLLESVVFRMVHKRNLRFLDRDIIL